MRALAVKAVSKNNNRSIPLKVHHPFESMVQLAPPIQKLSLSYLLDEWLNIKKGSLGLESYEIYCITAEKHIMPYFDKLNVPLQDIKLMHLQRYFNDKLKEYTPSTLKKHYTVLNGVFDYALYRLNIIYYNPMTKVETPKTEPRFYRCYNPNQLKLLIESVGGLLIETPVLLAARYGLRRSEILGLKWSAIDFDSKSIAIKHTVTKSLKKSVSKDMVKSKSSYRTLPLQPDVEKHLLRLRKQQELDKQTSKSDYDENDYICKKKDGTPLKPDCVTGSFRYYLKKYNLPHIRFHDLRHSAASMLMNAGFSLLEVCEWLGHADINTTRRYIHLSYSSKESISNYINQALSSSVVNSSVHEILNQEMCTDYK